MPRKRNEERYKPRSCLACQKEYFARNLRRKYCSTECARKASITQVKIRCNQCGEARAVPAHDVATKRFCSRKCYYENLKRNGRPNQRIRVTLTCERCTRSFDTETKNRHHRFCSCSCRAKWQASLPYEQWRGKIGAKNAGRLVGEQNHMWGVPSPHGKVIEHVRLDGSTQKLRSRWEAIVAAFLDARGVAWEYEHKTYKLADRNYRPDFWLPDQGVYWEVKGWFHDRHQETVRQFRELYPETPLVVIGLHCIRGFELIGGMKCLPDFRNRRKVKDVDSRFKPPREIAVDRGIATKPHKPLGKRAAA